MINLSITLIFNEIGSIDGSCMALEKGWAINLSGGRIIYNFNHLWKIFILGYHHAYRSSGYFF